MRQGAEGSWLFHLPFSTEPHEGALLYFPYLLAGKVSRFFNLPLVAAYHLTRIVATVALLAGAARFTAQFATKPRWRLISWGMLVFGGGADWLISMISPSYISFSGTAPEAFLFSVLWGPPHLQIAMALLIWLLLGALWLFAEIANKEQSHRSWLAIAVMALGELAMVLALPAYGLILSVVLVTYLLARFFLWRGRLVVEVVAVGLIGLPSIFYVTHLFWVLRSNPAMNAWESQYPFGATPWFNLLLSMSMYLTCGLLGLIRGQWWQNKALLLVVSWIAALPIIVSLPLSVQQRMIGGVQIVLALAAGYWLDAHLLPWLKDVPWRRIILGPAMAMGALILISYPVLFGFGAIGFVTSLPEELFLSNDEMATLEWLAKQEDGRVVLSAELTGNHVPAFSSATPVLGHPIETLAVEEKRTDVAHFFAVETSPAERQAILTRYGVDFVWWGPSERALGANSPGTLPDFREAFRHGDIQIWSAAR